VNYYVVIARSGESFQYIQDDGTTEQERKFLRIQRSGNAGANQLVRIRIAMWGARWI